VNSFRREPLRLRTERKGTAIVVHATGELDLAGAGVLEQEMKRISATHAAEIVLDLSAVDFIDSVGTSLLLRLDADSREGGDRLSIVPGSWPVQRVLKLTGADRTLRFVPAAA
jgi:anti-sigma B factor antagonist